MLEYQLIGYGDREGLSKEELNDFIIYLMNHKSTKFCSLDKKDEHSILMDNDELVSIKDYTVKVFRLEYLKGRIGYYIHFVNKVSLSTDYKSPISADSYCQVLKRVEGRNIHKEREIIDSIREIIKK